MKGLFPPTPPGGGYDPPPQTSPPLFFSPPSSSLIADDDDDEVFGRTLSDEEYLQVLQSRRDIFTCENDQRFKKIQIVNMILGIGFGTWVSSMHPVSVPTDFYAEKGLQGNSRSLRIIDPPDDLPRAPDIKEPPKVSKSTAVRFIPSAKTNDTRGLSKRGGDPRIRVTSTGILGLISGKVSGTVPVTGDVLGKGGYSEAIDAMLAGKGGLKMSGDGGPPKRGKPGAGFGDGWESGFRNSGDGGDDPLAGLMEQEVTRNVFAPAPRKQAVLIQASIDFLDPSGALTGCRTKSSIQRIVMQNMQALRYAYSKRLRENPDLAGKITVKFAIDEFGKVIICRVESSTFDDSDLASDIAGKIARWSFEKIDKPGDVTEVTYPFVFTP